MTKAELREMVRKAIDSTYTDSGSTAAADAAIAIVGKACAEICNAAHEHHNKVGHQTPANPDDVYTAGDNLMHAGAEYATLKCEKAILFLTQETPDA